MHSLLPALQKIQNLHLVNRDPHLSRLTYGQVFANHTILTSSARFHLSLLGTSTIVICVLPCWLFILIIVLLIGL